MLGPIAYIASLKEGIPSFINREIDGLVERGFSIDIYATKTGSGTYSPHLPFVSLSTLLVIRGNIYSLVSRPRRYFSALRTALETKTTREFAAGAAFARPIMRKKTRLIHSTFGDRKLFSAYYASRLSGIPLTVMVHSHELAFYLDTKILQTAFNHCTYVFAVCEWNKRIICDKFPELRNKVVVSRLFVNHDSYTEDRRTKILTVAKFHDYKGYDVLAKAAALLKDDNVVFWVVGDGPVNVGELFREEGAERELVLLGSVDEETLKILYQACDIFCLPSKTAPSGQREGLPVSIMEAMSYARPIVSTIHAGIPELVPSELVDENDHVKLAMALKSYVSDPEKRRMDGERNRRIVVNDYSQRNLDTFGDYLRQSMI